jgi:FMN phosphatase YigB (HAD superfamily)
LKQPNIEVILFDLGNVILPFNHYQIAEKLSRFSKNSQETAPGKIFSYLFDLHHGAVNEYETGKISTQAFFESLRKALELRISFMEFVPIWNEIFTENDEVSEVIRSLKGKKRLGLLSNTNPLHFDYVLAKFPIVWVLDRWILSHEVGFKKPAVEIFRRGIEWAAVGPERILYIDDIERYVDVAISLGMQGIHFISAPRLKEVLLSFLK